MPEATGSALHRFLFVVVIAILLAIPACDSSGPDEDTTAPSAPTDLSTSTHDGTIELSWEAASAEDLSNYQVYRGTDPSPTHQVATVKAGKTSYTDTELEDGQTYYYRLKAVDVAGNKSDFSGEVQAMLGLPAPAKLTAELVERKVRLSWEAVEIDGLTGYRIYRGLESEPTEQVSLVEASDTTYTDTDVEDSHTYYYRVTAVKGEGESGYSTGVSVFFADETAPAAPAGFEATAGDGEVGLDWQAVEDDSLAEYHLYRGTDPNPADRVATIEASVTSYTDTDVENGTEYFYRLTAADESGNESDYSETVNATPSDGSAPLAPTGLTAEGNEGQVSLEWKAVNDASLAEYRVFRSTASAPTKQVATVEAGKTSYTDTELEDGQTYYYRLKAVDEAGNESAYSEQVSAATADETAPAPPSTLTAKGNNEEVALTWEASSASDAATYRIYRGTSPGPTTKVAEVDASELSYEDTEVENGTQYYYRLRTVDEAGNLSSFSDEASATPADVTAPAAPTGFMAELEQGEVRLSWDPNSEDDVVRYRIYRGTSSPAETVIDGVAGDQTSYTDEDVHVGREYFYRITAVDEVENESDYSGEESVMLEGTPGVLFVDASTMEDGTGASWNSAFKYLQDAFDAVAGDPGQNYEIRVAEGVYYPDDDSDGDHADDDRSESFELSRGGVKIYGGYPSGGGSQNPGSNPTVLSGDITQDDATNGDGVTETTDDQSGENSMNVLDFGAEGADVTEAVELRGVTVTAGQADGDIVIGGGLRAGENLTVTDVTFAGNYAQYEGGAVYGDPMIEHSTFTGNAAGEAGGAISGRASVTNSTFTNNFARYRGGAVAGGTITNSTFTSNSVNEEDELGYDEVEGGGAVYGGRIAGSTFSNNTADNGGALYAPEAVSNATFTGNAATDNGGAIHFGFYRNEENTDQQISITGSLFEDNAAGEDGGAIYNNAVRYKPVRYAVTNSHYFSEFNLRVIA